MDWKRILNPWAALREAETTIAVLQDRLEDAYARADEAEGIAFHRAADHYWQRNKMLEAQLAHMQQRVSDIVAMTPPTFIIRTQDE